MKKGFTAILLAAVLVLSLLPVQAFAAETVPEGWTPIYTLADIKECQSGKYILMNDIDATKEDVSYDGNGYDANSVGGRLFSGGILDGNGHTIYNLKGPLFQYNMGTIKNLNVTISNIRSNTETSCWDIFTNSNVFAGIALYNSNGGYTGLIENCNVVMTVDSRFTTAGNLHIYGISSGGTIRNCIAKLDLNIRIDDQKGTLYAYGIGPGTNDSLVDHCLVLGSISIDDGNGGVEFAGISDCTATDSACALENLSVIRSGSTTDGPFDVFSMACLNGLSGTSSINNRVASDMNVYYQFRSDTIIDGKPGSGEGYTLASRSSILADWDLSNIPGEAPDDIPSAGPDETVEDPFPEGTAEFYYTATGSGAVKKYSFWYDSDFFNQNGELQPELAVASLCLEMAAFSNGDNLSWDSTLSPQDTRRAYNIQRLYETLGFINAQYVNYDKPLTDTSDKVAFSMAMKYIDNGKGGTDTLVAIPIRGGGYGGEWSSNFNLTDEHVSNYVHHIGFWTAMGDVWTSLDTYVAELEEQGAITGELKLWVTGFSRGAAVANLLAHEIMRHDDLGGVTVARKNLYAYTFATPAGMSEEFFSRSGEPNDSNIYNFISPVDVVPMVAPAQWGYGRYGVTVKLSETMSDDMCEHFRQLSDAEGNIKIEPSQRILLNDLLSWAYDLVPDALNYCSSGLQELLIKGAGAKLGANPADQNDEHDQTGLIEGLNLVMTGIKAVKNPITTLVKQGVKYSLEQELEKAINHVSYAHYAELYLCQLEEAAERSADLMEEAEEKQLLFPEKGINVRFWEHSNNSQVAVGSYLNGVCTSGDVIVEETAQGIVATFPAGKNYSVTVSGAGADQFGYIAYVYDSESDGPVRTLEFTDLPLDSGETYTGEVPEDPYGDYYVENSAGLFWTPDYDSEIDGERSPEYAVEIAFTDVSPDSYYYDAVQWAVEEGITAGTTPTTFSPNDTCTRAQVVAFLWRAAGRPEPETQKNPFTDVKKDDYFYKAVLWASENGIVYGTSTTTFSPNQGCTRGQVAAFLWRAKGRPEPTTGKNPFTDVKASEYYGKAVIWAAENKIVYGTSTTQFSPNASCTRAQIVTFLYRTYGK